jgi:hypothetical protein
VYAKIAELQALLDDGMSMMKNGNANGANDLFKEEKSGQGHGRGKGGRGKGKSD